MNTFIEYVPFARCCLFNTSSLIGIHVPLLFSFTRLGVGGRTAGARAMPQQFRRFSSQKPYGSSQPSST